MMLLLLALCSPLAQRKCKGVSYSAFLAEYILSLRMGVMVRTEVMRKGVASVPSASRIENTFRHATTEKRINQAIKATSHHPKSTQCQDTPITQCKLKKVSLPATAVSKLIHSCISFSESANIVINSRCLADGVLLKSVKIIISFDVYACSSHQQHKNRMKHNDTENNMVSTNVYLQCRCPQPW